MARATCWAVGLCIAVMSTTSAKVVPYKSEKIGPSIYDFMTSSSAALAMGHTAVMATDPGSEWINPAGQAMAADFAEGFTLYGTPFGLNYPELDEDGFYRHYSVNYHRSVGPVLGRRIVVSATAAHTRYTSREYPEITYDGYTGRTFRQKIRCYQGSLALAVDLGLRIAAGGTVRRVSEDLADWDGSGWGIDFGAMVEAPLDRWLAGERSAILLRPSAAIAWTNMGLSFDIEPFGEFESPTNRSLGIGLEFAVLDRSIPFTWRQVGVKIVYTGAKLLDVGDSTRFGVGAELCLVEALKVRLGQAYLDPYEPTTFGLELDSDGIRMLLAGLTGSRDRTHTVELLSKRHPRLSVAYSRHIAGDTIYNDGDLFGFILRY